MKLYRHQLKWEQRLFWRSRESAVFVFLFVEGWNGVHHPEAVAGRRVVDLASAEVRDPLVVRGAVELVEPRAQRAQLGELLGQSYVKARFAGDVRELKRQTAQATIERARRG